MAALRESDDAYPRVLTNLDDRWRVILCRDALQFILQRRISPSPDGWRGQRFCVTRAALLRDVREFAPEASEEGMRILWHLPDFADQMPATEASGPALAACEGGEE